MELETALARDLSALDIIDYRENDTGGNAFVGHLPEKPDAAVAFISTSPVGLRNEAVGIDGFDEPGVQIRIRGNTYDYSGSKAWATQIYEALVGRYHFTLDPAGIALWVMRMTFIQSGPIDIGRDDSERHEWTLNLTAHVRNQSTYRK